MKSFKQGDIVRIDLNIQGVNDDLSRLFDSFTQSDYELALYSGFIDGEHVVRIPRGGFHKIPDSCICADTEAN